MRTRPQFKVLSRAFQQCASRRRAIDRDGAVSVDRSRKHADHQRACTARGRELAALARSLPPQSISSATWSRTQRPALDVFPKSLARRTRPFIATAHELGKHEIHITRSLSLHLDEQGLCDVRGCAKQLGVFTMLWSSAGADVQHLVIACCRAGLAEPALAAREPFGRRPAYWSRPRPPAGRSRRERAPI